MYLVNSPEAASFMELMGTDTGRKVALGDKTKFNGAAFNAIGFAHNAVADAIPKVIALAQDPTRTTVDQHHAASQIAGKVSTVLEQSKASIEAAARELGNEGNQLILDQFALDPNRQVTHAEIRGWIREQASKPDGIMKIREEAKGNSELVAVLYDAPHFLTELSPDTRDAIIADGFQRFAPSGWMKIQQGIELTGLAAKYTKFPDKFHLYTCNRELANQGNRRVEI